MGNLCGKESADPFAQPGRTLASGPANTNSSANNNPTSSVPRKVGGPPRTLGSNSNAAQTDSQKEDARRKAAAAAEARAKSAGKPKGKLGSQLEGQKKQTRSETLVEASEEERLGREAARAEEERRYN